jgi:hypothetical protein
LSVARQDILASRACRVILRDRRYSPQRARALIRWLESDWAPTAGIAGLALAELGDHAFEDLLSHVARGEGLPRPNAVWAIELFPDQHDRLAPLLRRWLAQSQGELRSQCAVSLAHLLAERLRRHLWVDPSDVELVRSVLAPLATTSGGARVHLRGFEEVLAAAG